VKIDFNNPSPLVIFFVVMFFIIVLIAGSKNRVIDPYEASCEKHGLEYQSGNIQTKTNKITIYCKE